MTDPDAAAPREGVDPDFLAMLRAHRRVIESDDPDATLPPGVTHVLVTAPGQPARLIERRKSAF